MLKPESSSDIKSASSFIISSSNTAPIQVLSIPISMLSLTRAAAYSFFNQRDPVQVLFYERRRKKTSAQHKLLLFQADPTPPFFSNSLPVLTIYLCLMLPGYLMAWSLVTAMTRGFVFPLIVIVILIVGASYRYELKKGIASQVSCKTVDTFSLKCIRVKERLYSNLGQEYIDMADSLKWTSAVMSAIVPCVVGHFKVSSENTKNRTC